MTQGGHNVARLRVYVLTTINEGGGGFADVILALTDDAWV